MHLPAKGRRQARRRPPCPLWEGRPGLLCWVSMALRRAPMALVWLGPRESTPARSLSEGLGAETTRQGYNWSLQAAIPHPPCSLASIPEVFSSPDKSETEQRQKYLPFKFRLWESSVKTDLETAEILLTSLLPSPLHPRPLGKGRRIWKQNECDQTSGGWFLSPLRLSLHWLGIADQVRVPFP